MSAKSMTNVTLIISLLLLTLGFASAQEENPGVLNIYSSRHYGAMEAPFEAFTEATGIEVRVSQGSDSDLLARLQADIDATGYSVADLFLSIDAGTMGLAEERGLLQPVESDVISENLPEDQRDADGYWFALSKRARTVVYNVENVTEEELEQLNTYADVADPMWQGRLCMRPASHIYTVSLTSSLLYHEANSPDAETAFDIVEGWANNTTRYINSDTSQIKAVSAGECDIALVNHYYFARLINDEDPAVENVELKWLNQGEDNFGVFYNVNIVGVVKDAANYDNAVAFIEFMSSYEGQSGDDAFPGSNFEYPTNPEAEIHSILQGFGEVTFDTDYALSEYGSLQQEAVNLLEDAGFGFDEN